MRIRTTTVVTTWLATTGSGCVGVIVGSDSTKPDTHWCCIGSTVPPTTCDTAEPA